MFSKLGQLFKINTYQRGFNKMKKRKQLEKGTPVLYPSKYPQEVNIYDRDKFLKLFQQENQMLPDVVSDEQWKNQVQQIQKAYEVLNEQEEKNWEQLNQDVRKSNELISKLWKHYEAGDVREIKSLMKLEEQQAGKLINQEKIRAKYLNKQSLQSVLQGNSQSFEPIRKLITQSYQEKRMLWKFAISFYNRKSWQSYKKQHENNSITMFKTRQIHDFNQYRAPRLQFIKDTLGDDPRTMLTLLFFKQSQMELIAQYNDSLQNNNKNLQIKADEILSQQQYKEKQRQIDLREKRSNQHVGRKHEQPSSSVFAQRIEPYDITIPVTHQNITTPVVSPQNINNQVPIKKVKSVKSILKQSKYGSETSQDKGKSIKNDRTSQLSTQNKVNLLQSRLKQYDKGRFAPNTKMWNKNMPDSNANISSNQKKINPFARKVTFLANNAKSQNVQSNMQEEQVQSEGYVPPYDSDIFSQFTSIQKNLLLFGPSSKRTPNQLVVRENIIYSKDRCYQFLQNYRRYSYSHPIQGLYRAYQVQFINQLDNFNRVQANQRSQKPQNQFWHTTANIKRQEVFFPVAWLLLNLRKKLYYEGQMKRRDFDKLASASEYLKIYLPKEVSMPYNTNIDFDVDRIKWLFDSKKQHDIWYRIHNIKPEIFPKDVPLDEIYLIIAERNQSMPSTIDRSLLLPLAQRAKQKENQRKIFQELQQAYRAANQQDANEIQIKMNKLNATSQANQATFWFNMQRKKPIYSSSSQNQYNPPKKKKSPQKKTSPQKNTKFMDQPGRYYFDPDQFSIKSKQKQKLIEILSQENRSKEKKSSKKAMSIQDKESRSIVERVYENPVDNNEQKRRNIVYQFIPDTRSERSKNVTQGKSGLNQQNGNGNRLFQNLNYKNNLPMSYTQTGQQTNYGSVANNLRNLKQNLQKQFSNQRQARNQNANQNNLFGMNNQPNANQNNIFGMNNQPSSPIFFSNDNGNTNNGRTGGLFSSGPLFPQMNRVPDQEMRQNLYNNNFDIQSQPYVDPNQNVQFSEPAERVQSQYGYSRARSRHSQQNNQFQQRQNSFRPEQNQREDYWRHRDELPRGRPGGGGDNDGGGGGGDRGGDNSQIDEEPNIRNQNGLLNHFIVNHQRLLKKRDQLLKQTVRELVFKHLKQRLSILEENNKYLQNNGLNIFLSSSQASTNLISLKSDAEKYFHNKQQFYYEKCLASLKLNRYDFSLQGMIFQMGILQFMSHRFIKFQKGLIEREKILNQKITQNGERLIPISGTQMFLATHNGTSIVKYLYNGKYLTENQMSSLSQSQRLKIISDALLYLKQYHAQVFKTATQKQIQKEILLTQQFLKSR